VTTLQYQNILTKEGRPTGEEPLDVIPVSFEECMHSVYLGTNISDFWVFRKTSDICMPLINWLESIFGRGGNMGYTQGG